MNWLKGLGISVKVAIGALLMALAVMAAKRHKDNADKWRNKAVNIENGFVVKGIETVAAANTQAKIHDNMAKAIGSSEDIERFKRIFGHTDTTFEECKY